MDMERVAVRKMSEKGCNIQELKIKKQSIIVICIIIIIIISSSSSNDYILI